MIRILPRACITETAKNVWALAQDAAEQCYPLVKSAEDFENTLKWALEDDAGKARSYWRGRQLLGICCLVVDEEKRYAQVIALYAWEQFRLVANAFLEWIDETYSAYIVDVGIAGEHVRLAGALDRHGYRVVDDCLDLRQSLPAADVAAFLTGEKPMQLDKSRFGVYASKHDAWFPDLYWNAQRLAETPDGWTVLIAQNDVEIAGALLLIFGKDLAEIYGLHAADEAMARALLNAALVHCSDEAKGYRTLLFMTDVADEMCVRAALGCGFVQTGRYVGWRKASNSD